ncbi:hypothetical protein [Candidatus Albibeggiatoa sp. nov. NOAA]|uniref:hypothetical protein n=1 Tax=Candidatus Albibeggiatoa sp. nov. NOAA TaxID=3162724 RepID=UPI0032F63476|nr:hypothetical protein [Thiotrichaceae bacterium]
MENDESCYCQERQRNPELAKALKEIPEGYCGICEVCGKWGHTRAHPRLPITSAWCDEHWEQLANHKIINLAEIIHFVGLLLILSTAAYMLWQFFTPF